MAFGPVSVAAQQPIVTPDGDPVLEREVLSRIDVDRALAHLRHFTDVIGPRFGGTPNEIAAAHYLADELESYGYEVQLQGFPVADKSVSTIGLSDEPDYQGGLALNGRLTAGAPISGELVYAGTGLTADQFPENTAGKIVLMENATANAQRDLQVANAVERGATGVILRRTQASPFDPALTVVRDIPVAGVGGGQGDRLRAKTEAGPYTVTLDTTRHTGLTSYNVIATKPPTVGDDPDNAPIIMVGGHYDSVRGAPGANDDGSGTMLTLELARVFADFDTDVELRFGFWGSEEQGLIGSNYYVANSPQSEYERYLGMWQNDMVATDWDIENIKLHHVTAHGAHNLVTESVARVSSRLGYTSVLAGPLRAGGSDHVPFHNRGIAAANHSWHPDINRLTLEPEYHTPEDTIENNLSLERWEIVMNLVGGSVFLNSQTAGGAFESLVAVAGELELTADQWKLDRFLDRIEREMAKDGYGEACRATAIYNEEIDRLAGLRPERGPLDPNVAYELSSFTSNLWSALGC